MDDNNTQPENTNNQPTETPKVNDVTPQSPTNEVASSGQPITVTTDDSPTTNPTQPEMPGHTDPPKAVVGGEGNKKGVFIGIIVLLIIAGLAAVGYQMTKPQSTTTKVVVVSQKKDIADLKVVPFSPLPHTYYPDVQNDELQTDINSQMFEGLTKFVDGTTLKPGLASSWTNPDTSTWVFTLLPNVTFHTGKTMTASDVKASIEAIEPTDYGKAYASTIKSVDVVDAQTVKITTKGPDPILANELTQLFIFDTTSTKKNDPINGTGPYNLKSDTADSISLVAYDKYHGGHVYSRQVDYMGYDTTTSVPKADLTSHAIQVLAVTKDQEFTAQLKNYGYNLALEPAYNVGHLVFNTSKAGTPFANVKVRQAIAQALDKNALIVASQKTGSTPANQTIAEGIPGYNPNIKAVAFSTANAKAALAAAGYPNGFTFKLTYFPPNQALAEEVQKELALIGVKVTLDPESDQKQLVKIAIGGGTDMYYNSVSSSYVDGSDVLSDFIDSANYSNPALNKLNDAASKELNQSKRVAILQQMGALVESDQADVPLYQRQAYTLASAPKVVVSREFTSGTVGIYYWQVYSK